jgi:MFS family permease
MILSTSKDLRESGDGQRSLAVALAVVLLNVFISETLPLMIHDLREQMGLTTEQVNLIRFLPATAGLLIAPSAGNITDRWGVKRVLTLSLATICFGSLVIAISNTINVLIIGLLLTGLGLTASMINGYTLLTKSATNSRQLGLFIASWGITSNIGYLLFPPLGSWIVVHSLRGWSSISTLWIICYLTLLIVNQLQLKDGIQAEPGQQEQLISATAQHKLDWAWLGTAGIIFSLTTAIPVIDVLKPVLTGPLIAIDAVAIALLCNLISRSRQAKRDLLFMRKPAIVLALCAVAATNLVDWNYFSERFISFRYLMDLSQTSIWLTPANLSGLLGVSLFGTISLRLGLFRTTAVGLVVWLLTPLVFLFARTSTPVWIIAGSIAIFTLVEALVYTGLQSSATQMAPKSSLGTFGAVMTGLNTITDSIGGALSSDVIINTYQESLSAHLSPLPMSDSLTAKILKWMAEGNYHLALESDYKIPAFVVKNYIQKGTPARIDSYVDCLHALGYLCTAMVVITGLLYGGSLVAKARTIRQHNR